MPEDVIARAIAEQASRSPKELGAVAPGVVVGLGNLGLSTLILVADLLSAHSAPDQGLDRVQLVLLAPPTALVPEGYGIAHVAVEAEWNEEELRLRHIDEWLSPELARKGAAEPGIRQADRLAFFTKYQEIRQQLQAARNRAQLQADPAAVGCTFYLVAGLGEENGSGMFLDAAQLAGQLLEGIAGGQVVGYLALPGAAVRTRSRLAGPGAFAALKELDFFNSGGELAVRYAAGAPAMTLHGRLFSACYLFDEERATDARTPGGVGNEAKVAEVIALHILGDFLPGGVACTSRAVRERHSRFARPGREDQAGCQAAYRALGAARLYLDSQRLGRGYRLAFAHRLMDRLLAHRGGDLPGDAERLERLTAPWAPGDSTRGLAGRLTAAPDGTGSFEDTVRSWLSELERSVETRSPRKGAGDWLAVAVAELANRFGSDGIGGVLDSNLDEALSGFEADLDASLAEIIRNAGSGSWFTSAEQFLVAVQKRLAAFQAQVTGRREHEAEVLAGCESFVKDCVADVDRAFGHPLARFGSSRRLVTERSLAALWRGLEELLIARLRLEIWGRVPVFYDRASTGVEQRLQALGAVQNRLENAAGRISQELERILAEPARPGELFDRTWIVEEVDHLLEGDPALLEAMSGRLLSRLGASSPLDLPGLLEQPDFDMRLSSAIRMAGDEAMLRVPARSVAERLAQLHPPEAEQLEVLRRALESAAPMLALEAREGAPLPASEACSLLVGIPGGPANPRGSFAPLLDLLLLCLDDLGLQVPISIADLPGPGDQVLFIRECAGFPLRCLATVDDLAARYREHMRQPRAEPVHIVKDPGAFETIPGIFPPDPKARRRALEAFAVGVPWGVFEIENGIIVHRQKLPGMTFLDTRILGTMDRPLRAVKYLIDHPDLVQHAHGRIAAIVEEMRANSALRQERLARLERHYLRLLEQCREIVTGPAEGMPDAASDEVIRKLPLWELAEAILTFNARHGLEAAPAPSPELTLSRETPIATALCQAPPPVPALPQAAGPQARPHAPCQAPPLAPALPQAAEAHAGPHAPCQAPPLAPALPQAAGPQAIPQVQCPQCLSVWPATAKFCAECATPLRCPGVCPKCQSPTPPGGKFCPECATPLSVQPAARSG